MIIIIFCYFFVNVSIRTTRVPLHWRETKHVNSRTKEEKRIDTEKEKGRKEISRESEDQKESQLKVFIYC